MKQLIALTAEEVLRAQVATVAQATSDTERLPRVRVTVGSHEFVGVPVRIDDRRGVPWIVMVDRDSVMYLPLRSVVTVVVEHVEVVPLPDPPSRLQIERALAAVQMTARGSGWHGTLAIGWPDPITEEHRRALDAAVSHLGTVLAAVNTDELGKQSLATVTRIVLVSSAGTELAVTRKDTTMEITIGLAATVDESTLRQLVEQQL